MAQVGIVKTLEGGVFYAKDSSGNIRELSIGDSISENEVVYGDSSNQTSAKVEMELSGNDIIVLNQAQQQLIDSSLNQVTFGNEEVIFSKGDINTTFENADLSAWNNTTDDVSDDMETAAGDPTQQETQAGEEEPTEEGRVTARFSARDGSSTDVRSDLRDTIDFGTQSSESVNDDEIAAELLNPQATTTEPTTPTIPVDTRVEASKITLSNPTVDEGKDITITATVDNAPQTDLVITLNNGEKITIKAGETTGSTTFTNPNTEDVYKDSSTETYTISGTEGGNYKDLDISDKSTVKVTDTEDTVTVKLTATPSTTEGGEITYTVTLVDAKGNPVDTKTGVTVELSNGKTITIDANSSSKSLTIDAETDDVYVDAKDVSVSIKDVIETNKGAENSFEKLVADKTPVDTKVTDTEDTVTVKLTATPSTTEGGEITYTVTLVDAKG
ncbi:immunoglobulin-like domain-containing protein, partial [Aliarcobacter butzleri]|uniref:immunoglobulin-like domain-containing protein n=1 Tax=Aliarcobacter butzleri TaxID=28197 RepID=UPI002B23F723